MDRPEQKLVRCRACKTPNAAKPHCESPTCSWLRCEVCHVTYCPTRDRGWDAKGNPISLGG